jgi:hypothetical protein
MIRIVSVRAVIGATALITAPWASGLAQFGTLTISGADTVGAAPRLVAHVAGSVADSLLPVTLQLDISASASFSDPIYSVTRTGDTATFLLPRLLPQNSTVYFRLQLFAASGRLLSTEVSPIHHVGAWLTLVSPSGLNNVSVVGTRQPTFVWHSSAVTTPPGPWLYDLSVVNVATQVVEFFTPFVRDTAYTVPTDLQANTSYRWNVVARVANGSPLDTVRVASDATFVILSSDVPRATLLYQNFPNPFPTSTSAVTCFWFDLRASDVVHLDIYDLRGNLVKTIVPSAAAGSSFAAGAYGRNLDQGQSGCDPRYSWDGTASNGRFVPAGIYVVRLRANGQSQTKHIVYRGR